MDEAHRGAEDQHIGDDLPPRPPGLRNGASGEHSGAAAEDDGHQKEDAERAFLVEEFRHGEVDPSLYSSIAIFKLWEETQMAHVTILLQTGAVLTTISCLSWVAKCQIR